MHVDTCGHEAQLFFIVLVCCAVTIRGAVPIRGNTVLVKCNNCQKLSDMGLLLCVKLTSKI